MSEERDGLLRTGSPVGGQRLLKALLDVAPKRRTVSFWGDPPVSHDGHPAGPTRQVMPQLVGVIDYDVKGDWFYSMHADTRQVVITRIPSLVRRITVDAEQEMPQEFRLGE